MKKPAYSFIEARDAFVKALNDYQTATRDMSLALQRIADHSHGFYAALDTVVRNPVVAQSQRR